MAIHRVLKVFYAANTRAFQDIEIRPPGEHKVSLKESMSLPRV